MTIEKGNFDYKDLEQIIILSNNLHKKIEQINKLELWSSQNLFKDQLDELNRIAPTNLFCLQNLEFISNSVQDAALSSSKKEIIENYLFSKLVGVLQNKLKKDYFEMIKLEIVKAKIENSSHKSILIAQFESNDKNKQTGLSLNNFVLKYKYRLNWKTEKCASLFQVTQNVIQYCQYNNSNERLQILKDLIFLTHSEYLSFEEIVVLLKMLLNIKYDQNKSIKLFVAKLGKNLSTKAEHEIGKKVNNAEFSQIFSQCIQNRVDKISGPFVKKISALVAFYEQVNQLLDRFNKPGEENEFEKNAILAINYANCPGQVGAGQNFNQNLSSAEKKFLKKICAKIDENLNDFEIFEIFIFELVNIQLKKESKQLSLMWKNLQKFESDNFQIKWLKAYLNSIIENVNKNTHIDKMLENLNKVDKFVPYVKKLLDKNEFKNDHHLSELIDLSLKKKFQNDHDQQVGFVIECIRYSRLEQNETKMLFLDMVKLLNIDQLICIEKIECLFSLYNAIEECDKFSQNLKILENKISLGFKEFCAFLKERCNKIDTTSIDTNIELVIDLVIDLTKNLPTRLNMSVQQLCDFYILMIKLNKLINDFEFKIVRLSSVDDIAQSGEKLVNVLLFFLHFFLHENLKRLFS